MPPAPLHIARPASRRAPRPRLSPNRRREIGRMVFWNLVMAAAVVALPIVF